MTFVKEYVRLKASDPDIGRLSLIIGVLHMIPADKRIERLTQVARMYYEQDMNQSEIAKELGVSRPLVSVLLSEARECGIVTITINNVESAHELLARRLESRFGLRKAEVVEDAASAEATNDLVAARAYELCFRSGERPRSVGLGWGSMLGRMADYAETLPEYSGAVKGRLFPLIGGIGASYRGYHTNELARIVSGKAGFEAEYLYLPAFFDSEAELDFARRLETWAAVQNGWDTMELALVNISNYPSYPDLGVEYRFGGLLTERKAVGRLLAHYYDEAGCVIEAKVSNALQASVEQLRRAPRTVAVCSTLLRPQSVIGALGLGVIDTLCLPQSLADKVLEMA